MARTLFACGLLMLLVVAGCASKPVSMKDIKKSRSEKKSADIDWKDIELTDVKSGKVFKVSDFAGKPVLLESFAVWCPTCKRQQDQVKKLHEDVGDSVVSISLDTDPNEDERNVAQHLGRYGYDWLFAVDTNGFAKKLVDEFGVNVVNAPAAPIILICENEKRRLLAFGVKSADDLKREIEQGCD